MKVAGEIVVGLVAALHLYFLYLEMVLWTTPKGRAIFGTTEEQAEQSAALAKNQGLYNGFLAAALVWGIVARNSEAAFEFKVYGLACVIAAAVVGALTVSRRILVVQGLPAVVGIVLVLIGGR
ncbi:MAG: putative rane protein [Pseudonocardiales bacterium]|nr:putative rane protein [Pseudonocardiales bacterium]